MDGGTFAFNEEKDGYDTPESAKYILHNLLVSHGDALGKLRMPDSDRSLAEVAADALEATEPAAAVTAALNVMDELKLQKEVLPRAVDTMHKSAKPTPSWSELLFKAAVICHISDVPSTG